MAKDTLERQARQQILDAALALFAGRGFEETSVQDIAQHANTGPRTVSWHFGDKTELYTLVVELAGDRFLHAMCGHLVSRRATLAETLADWVRTLEKGGNVSALICAGSGGDWNPTVYGAFESLNHRLVEFWQQRLEMWRHRSDAHPIRCRELAHLIVAAAPAFAAMGPAVLRSALMADFAAAAECMALAHDIEMDPEAGRQNGTRHDEDVTHVAHLDRPSEGNGHDACWFSPRELEVLREVEKGISNKEIARALEMTEHTVKFHLKNIFRKLSVVRRTEALRVARELHVI